MDQLSNLMEKYGRLEVCYHIHIAISLFIITIHIVNMYALIIILRNQLTTLLFYLVFTYLGETLRSFD